MIVKTGYYLIGILSLTLGIIGIFLPVMPTTVFMLIAVWAFARSSPRLHNAILEHPRTGPAIKAWQENQYISKRAKLLAVISIMISWVIVRLTTPLNVSIIVGIILLLVVIFLLTRPSTRLHPNEVKPDDAKPDEKKPKEEQIDKEPMQ